MVITKNPFFKAWKIRHKGMDAESMQLSLASHLLYTCSKDIYSATERDLFFASALATRDRVNERWILTQQGYYQKDVKQLYYLSAEYLMGRALTNNLINLGIYEQAVEAATASGLDLASLAELEPDAGLGNGGLGRLAACFLDSLATLRIPASGYGIRYEFGIFEQAIRDCRQVELPDEWLKFGSPWEVPRPERTYPVDFYGYVQEHRDAAGRHRARWVETQPVLGMAYDVPIVGYRNDVVNTLRLWSARACNELDLELFQDGRYHKAVEEKNLSENLSKVLYPCDNSPMGKELRLKQQYFFVSCSIQDMLRRYLVSHDDLRGLPDKAAVQLNDTHPSLAVPELMRLLVDRHDLSWDVAWDITTRTLAYTNHTLLAEALEKWPVGMLGRLLPRHLQIIEEINRRFLRDVAVQYLDAPDRLRRMSLFEEGGEKQVRMAHLAIVGSHAVNGVSKLHTELLRQRELRDFDEMFPGRFSAKTNGVTPRRWLLVANPGLSRLISSRIGDGWVCDLERLRELEPYADDPEFRARFREVKQSHKHALAALTAQLAEVVVDPGSIFDVQIKRIHLYKRQLLNVLQIIATWLQLKSGELDGDFHPRTFYLGGKAAPGYKQAKDVIRLIGHVAQMINRDPATSERLKVAFLPNYRVTLAERMIPAADVSVQVSTAGYEASGTGNMKFALNGALTLGTLDGANVEIEEQVGTDNIFIFGMTVDEVAARRASYRPREVYEGDPLLRQAVDMIREGFFSPELPELFRPLMDELLSVDSFMILADFKAYLEAQRRVNSVYLDPEDWSRRAILNVARCGIFSSDRTIREYNREIWRIPPQASPPPR